LSSIPETLIRQVLADAAPKTAGPKRGDAIFEGLDYPREWSGFVGQEEAREELIVAIASAIARGTRLDHILLASGIAGVGKTTLAYLVAYNMGVGITATSGPLTMEKARDMIRAMQDGDILFWDEFHTAVAGNKNRADWLLPFLTDGAFYTDRGVEQMPDITVIGATTDAGKLPTPLLSRFMITPTIERYTSGEAAAICRQLAGRLKVTVPAEALSDIAEAANNNPRIMRKILGRVRDLGHAYPETHPNLEKAFKWSGMSADGLTQIARDILLLLYGATDHTSSVDFLRKQLGEPGPIDHQEQELFQRALLTITGRGRKLTDAGLVRAREEAIARS